jgi:surface protein
LAFWVMVCKVRGWQCAKDDRGTRLCDSDSGGGVTLVEAWTVCGACVHARMMRVGMMCRGFHLLAVFNEASAFNSDLSAWDVSAVTNMRYSAPHTISSHAHMSSSHWLFGWWFATCGVGNVRRTIGRWWRRGWFIARESTQA